MFNNYYKIYETTIEVMPFLDNVAKTAAKKLVFSFKVVNTTCVHFALLWLPRMYLVQLMVSECFRAHLFHLAWRLASYDDMTVLIKKHMEGNCMAT